MALTTKEIITAIRDKFNQALTEKSGWGKNELKQMHDNIIIDVLSNIEYKEPRECTMCGVPFFTGICKECGYKE